jgi:hypothetical protein
MAVEYMTTIGEYRLGGRPRGCEEWVDPNCGDVPEPREEGWTLVSTAAADGLLFYTWRRHVAAPRVPPIQSESALSDAYDPRTYE